MTASASAPLATASLANTALAVSALAVPPQNWSLQIDGMTCASCAGRVEKALARVDGVVSAEVNLATETAQVRASGGRAGVDALVAALVAAVVQAGYAARLVPDAEDTAAVSPLPRPTAPWWPVAVAAALSLPLAAPMLGLPFGRHLMLDGWLQLAPARSAFQPAM